MNWNLDKQRPICPQLYEQICIRIVNGEYKVGDKVPSVRELALKLGVTPNTVQRSYENLESDGILYTIRATGRYVSENIQTAIQIVEEIKRKKTMDYFSSMNSLGLNNEEIKTYIKELIF